MADQDERIDKRRVTMTNYEVGPVVDGQPTVLTHQVTDYVRPDHLDAYVADARTRWANVEVSDEPDAGPGGFEGQTAVPAGLPVPDAGVVYEAEEN